MHSAPQGGALVGFYLPPGARPTNEKKPNYGAAKEPRPGSSKFRDLVIKSQFLFYRYDRLKEGQVRILTLQPATQIDADIYIEIHTVKFEELKLNRSWQALSYHWGDVEESEPVYVRNALRTVAEVVLAVGTHKDDIPDDSGPLIPFVRVGGNLYNALKNMREIGAVGQTHGISLWVDAICINQGDKTEKSQQVAMMAELYAASGRVCIWLGSRDNHGRRIDAMEFVKEIAQEWNSEKLICDETAQRWINFVFLLRSGWFSRRWVIQELALAEEATVRCGAYEVHWKDFADAIGFFSFYLGEIKKVARAADGRLSADEKNDLKALTDLDTPQATKLVDEIANAFRKHPSGKLLEPTKDLETLVSTLTAFDSSDPRDTIFALLNIARETSYMSPTSRKNLPSLRPDYTQDTLRIYVDFLDWVIKSTDSLDILCRQWALPEDRQSDKTSLPSWINRKPSAKKNAKSFVGLPGGGYYNASRNQMPEVTFGLNTMKGPGKITQKSTDKRRHSVSVETQQQERNSKRAKLPMSGNRSTAQFNRSDDREGYQGLREIESHDSPATSHDRAVEVPPIFSKTPSDPRKTNGELMDISQAVRAQPDSQPFEAYVQSPTQAFSPESNDSQATSAANDIAENSMFVTGLILGTIRWTVFFPDGVITQTALEKLGWKSKKEEFSHQDLPDRVWRTLVADRGPNGDQPPNWYHKACLQCLTQETPNGHMNLKEMLRDEAASGRTMKREFIERVEAATWERAIIANEKKESDPDHLVWLGPKGTQSGDIVCILFGCSVPCILRRWRKTNEENPHYKFIGEAFVYGKMEGQALEKFDREKEKPTTFRII